MTDATAIIISSSIAGGVAGTMASIPAIITALRTMPRLERKVDDATRAMDGPLSAAVKTAAVATAKLAEAVPTPENILAAAQAKIIHENRQAGKSESSAT